MKSKILISFSFVFCLTLFFIKLNAQFYLPEYEKIYKDTIYEYGTSGKFYIIDKNYYNYIKKIVKTNNNNQLIFNNDFFDYDKLDSSLIEISGVFKVIDVKLHKNTYKKKGRDICKVNSYIITLKNCNSGQVIDLIIFDDTIPRFTDFIIGEKYNLKLKALFEEDVSISDGHLMSFVYNEHLLFLIEIFHKNIYTLVNYSKFAE